jgi:hypothetical protein
MEESGCVRGEEGKEEHEESNLSLAPSALLSPAMKLHSLANKKAHG